MMDATFIRWRSRTFVFLALALVSGGCMADGVSGGAFVVESDKGTQLYAEPLGVFEQPWAMTFLPDGRLLVTEKTGQLWLVDLADKTASGRSADSARIPVSGLPPIKAQGQGGLGDVIVHPEFADNAQVYISFVEREDGLSGAAVARARLSIEDHGEARLLDLDVIWRQSPKVSGAGHYGHRLAFGPDRYLYITSGERQKFNPAQDMEQNLGKVVRLHDDGSVPADNPFASEGEIAAQVWSLGHRNPLGIAFDNKGQLWVHEMGPRGGDELNRVVAGDNFGYPIVSNGRHYSGLPIPDHDTRPEFAAPAISWNPVISPAGFVIYSGQRYENWEGSGLLGGLSSRSLVRVALSGNVHELERFDMRKRIREVEEGPDGLIYVLEDKSGGRLLRLNPGKP